MQQWQMQANVQNSAGGVASELAQKAERIYYEAAQLRRRSREGRLRPLVAGTERHTKKRKGSPPTLTS
jgi:hypothetical protein